MLGYGRAGTRTAANPWNDEMIDAMRRFAGFRAASLAALAMLVLSIAPDASAQTPGLSVADANAIEGGSASFVVSLELRATDVTAAADVVLPVAPMTDKAGTFVTWDGRARDFVAVFANPASLPDLRVLSGIAEEMGRPLGFRTVAEVRAEMQALGPWDGARPALDAGKAPRPAKAGKAGSFALATWKQLIDLGSMQDGEAHLRATARPPVVRLNRAAYESVFGLLDDTEPGGSQLATVTGDRGSITLPVVVTDLPDGVVWVPARSFGRGVLAELASPGSTVTVKGASK